MKVKFTPKELSENVNVSKGHPLKDFAIYIIGIAGVLALLFYLSSIFVDVAAPYIPVSVEKNMGDVFFEKMCTSEIKNESERLTKILNKLIKKLPKESKRFDYRVCVQKMPVVNAIALPGGNIIVYSKLIEQASSEMEIASVLAHELGHFHNYDHLKMFGRSLISLVFFSVLNISSDSLDLVGSSSSLISNSSFSKSQEKAADLFSVKLMKSAYGDGAPIIHFMDRLLKENESLDFLYYFSSHPHPHERKLYIKEFLKSIDDSIE